MFSTLIRPLLFVALLAFAGPLAGCADNTPEQNAITQIAVTASGLTGVEKGARIAYDAGYIKPNSDADKALTAAFHASQKALHNANDQVKAGNYGGVTYYLNIASSFLATAGAEVLKWVPPNSPAAVAVTTPIAATPGAN
jgi:hypothetical protein